MDAASVLGLREPEPSRREGSQEEPEIATPISCFDPYEEEDDTGGSPRPDVGGRAGSAAAAGPDGESPRVRIAMTTTVVEYEEDAALSPACPRDAAANDGLALPASPRDGGGKNRFVVTFKDVQSPEKQAGFVPQQPPQAGRRKRTLPSPARRVEEEGLGDDWATRPWKEPSVGLAKAARRRALVRQGLLPLWSTDPDDLLFLGAL
jgi:hypothetical protein